MEMRRSDMKLQFLIILYYLLPAVKCLEVTRDVSQVRRKTRILSEPSSSFPDIRNPFKGVLLGVALGSLIGIFLAICILLLIRGFVQYVKRIPILEGPVIFFPKVTPETLQAALSAETQVLGSGPNQKCYRTVLENGLDVAVKRLDSLADGSPMEAKAIRRKVQPELELLAQLQHRNLLNLRAYLWHSNKLSLVYNYMPTGSLEDVMSQVRGSKLQLRWEIRHRIAVGIIKGLRYLHFECNPRVLHCGLKPSNVVLDTEFEPKLADSGLARIVPSVCRRMSIYLAPECFQSCRYTDKSDIYSFGMILALLLTGRDPLVGDGRGGTLGWWLRHLQHAGDARECLDKSILGEAIEEDEMVMAVRIAVICLSDLPSDRPSSDELVPLLTQLRSF